jgi:hypothetical protein
MHIPENPDVFLLKNAVGSSCSVAESKTSVYDAPDAPEPL